MQAKYLPTIKEQPDDGSSGAGAAAVALFGFVSGLLATLSYQQQERPKCGRKMMLHGFWPFPEIIKKRKH